MSTIQGLDLRAKDESGQEIETFKVQWINKGMAFGVIGDGTTEKKFLELFVPKLRADIDQIARQNKRLKVYAQHLPSCNMLAPIRLVSKNGKPVGCDCGLEQALKDKGDWK